jgi:hypothetical protein
MFPPPPRGLRGRAAELTTLERTIVTRAPTRLALVGSGGSGKSMLACALGHRLAPHFAGQVHWFRVGSWDFQTLVEMLALGFGTSRTRARLVPGVRRFLRAQGPRLIVLDNHEDDAAMARLLQTFADTPVSFIITARRCLLGGVLIYPISAPLVTSGGSAFPRVARLTRALRWNPLALDIADAVVASGAARVSDLERFLTQKSVESVRVIEHEDDLPEVATLIDWAWQRLSRESRRLLGVLAYMEGDHMDVASLAKLARVPRNTDRALAPLLDWHLVQQPLHARYTLHAVVRHAIKRRTQPDPAALFEHYVALLEQHPERLLLEQTHLFSAMDYAQRSCDLGAILRIDRLMNRLYET